MAQSDKVKAPPDFLYEIGGTEWLRTALSDHVLRIGEVAVELKAREDMKTEEQRTILVAALECIFRVVSGSIDREFADQKTLMRPKDTTLELPSVMLGTSPARKPFISFVSASGRSTIGFERQSKREYGLWYPVSPGRFREVSFGDETTGKLDQQQHAIVVTAEVFDAHLTHDQYAAVLTA